MIEGEYETSDLNEMGYIIALAQFPYEYDKTNPKKIIMRVKGKRTVIISELAKYWEDFDLCRRFSVGLRLAKQQTFKSGIYLTDYYKKREITNKEITNEDSSSTIGNATEENKSGQEDNNQSK